MNNIAVVIPVGPNHARIARRAVRSVLQQSYYAQAIIANDTGRMDRCDDNAIQVDTAGAEGVGTARQMGTELAANLGYDAVVYLDADDMLLPRAIEAMVRTFKAVRPAYVYGDGYNIIDGKAEYFRAADYSRERYGVQNIHNVTALLPITTALAVRWTNEHWEDYIFYSSLALAGLCGARAAYPVIAYDHGAGERRLLAYAHGSAYARGLLADFRSKLELSKGVPVMGCCTPGSAMSAWGEPQPNAAPDVTQPPGTVAMGYSGANAGGIEFRVNGRAYNGEAGGVVYANPADVAGLISFGKFYEIPSTPDAESVLADMIAEAANTSNAEVDALIMALAKGNETAAAMSALGIISGADQNIAALDDINEQERHLLIASALGVPAELLTSDGGQNKANAEAAEATYQRRTPRRRKP